MLSVTLQAAFQITCVFESCIAHPIYLGEPRGEGDLDNWEMRYGSAQCGAGLGKQLPFGAVWWYLP